jgi:hypothetical protein
LGVEVDDTDDRHLVLTDRYRQGTLRHVVDCSNLSR